MSSTAAGWLQFALLVVALAACYVPLGNYIARVFTDTRHWRVERGIYKLCGIDPEAGVDLTYFVDDKGFAKETCRMPGPGPTWSLPAA